MESKKIKMDKFMIALFCIINILTIAIIFVLSGIEFSTTTEKIKGIFVIVAVVIMACISNSAIIAAALIRKDR